jgi:signal transduction histidine kinase/HAMP domain-containing protein
MTLAHDWQAMGRFSTSTFAKGKNLIPTFGSSLRSRLVLLVLIAVGPVFALILYNAERHRQLTSSQVKINALAAARAIASEQDRVLENAHQFLVTLARIPQIRESDKAACHKVLSGLLEPIYLDLAVTDVKGQILCTALSPANALASGTGRHHKRTVETQDFSLGDLRVQPASGKIILDLGYPVSDAPGRLRAVLSAALDLNWLTRLTVDNRLYSGANFTLVSADGKVLLRYPETTNWKAKQVFSPTPRQPSPGRDSELTIESTSLDGINRLFALSPLKNPIGGQMVYAAIDIPVSVAFAEPNRILLHDLILLALLSIIALSAAWFGTELFLLRRVRDIITTTKKVAAGILSARTARPYENNELGLMARAFDDLVGALEKRQAEALGSAQQVQQQRQQQKALYDLNLGITSTLDLSDVLKILLDHISELFPFCTVTVSWLDKGSGNLRLIAHRGSNDTEKMYTDLASAQDFPLLVLKQQSPVAVSRTQIDAQNSAHELFRRYNVYSFLGLPLIAKDEILGVLSFYSQAEREFNAEEINFLNALVNQAAIAIFNSRLFEQTREQAIELEKSNKIKDEFLGVMSHELRTPLNIIMNYAEVLKMGAFGEISAEQLKGTEKIHSQAGHLLTLINGILEITKIESGTTALQTEFLNLSEFMADCKSDYMAPMDKDLRLEWHFPTDLPTVTTDRMRLKQIMTNLINNAIKFTEQGYIRISAHVDSDGETFELCVADTGPGIPEDRLARIFEKFHQIDSATTRNYAGAGLGLYIVKTFVDLFQGTICVESKIGVGSTFTVRLPIKVEVAAISAHQLLTARPDYLN